MTTETSGPLSPISHRSAHPVVFLFFQIPYGLFSGYLTITLAYLFSRSGISIAQIAGLAAINIIPQILKFLWAPLVDTTLSLKKWYFISAMVTAVCIFITGVVPLKVANLPVFTFMIFLSSFARSFVSAALNGLAAHDTPEELKGRVAGYGQAGALGGSAIGGGIGLWLAEHTHYQWIPGTVLACICALCCFGLLFVKEHPSTIKVDTVKKTVNNLVKDIWLTIKTKRGVLALLLCIIPLGSGASGYLFAAISADWGASAGIVAIVTGIVAGVITIAGSLAGGWICDRVNRQQSYVVFGLLQAICCLGLAFCPHTPVMYILWTLAYTFANGLSYAAWTAFALEATGRGAAASKFELFASVSWLPIYTMTAVAGFAYTKWKANGMLTTEAACGILAAVLFLAIQKIIKSRKATPQNAEAVFINS